MKPKTFILATIGAASLLPGLTVPNPSFEQGTDVSVSHWSLTDKAFGGISDQAAQGRRSIFIRGNGATNHYWLSDTLPFIPNQTYKLTYKANATPGTYGCIMTGSVFANFDEKIKSGTWQDKSVIFTVPEHQPPHNYKLRFGQWMAMGKVMFDDIKIIPVQAVYQSVDGITLGDGEKVSINEYDCTLTFNATGHNHARPLVYTSAAFNSNRWVFGQGSQVIYCHDIGKRRQMDATLSMAMNYHVGGKLIVCASKDQKSWRKIGELDKLDVLNVKLPKDLFPAERMFIKLEALGAAKFGAKDSDPGSFQINRYNYKATVEGAPTSITGTTAYMDVDNKRADLELQLLSIDDCVPGRVNYLRTKVTNKGDKPMTLTPQAYGLQQDDSSQHPVCKGPEVTLLPKAAKLVPIPFQVGQTGSWTIIASLTDQTTITFPAIIPHYLATGYGQMLAQTPETATVWNASSGWKINPRRELPTDKADRIDLALAANEAEATQIVITPAKDLTGVTLTKSAFKTAEGQSLTADSVELLQVYYHDVKLKTDYTGYVGRWPDALPPIDDPLTLKAKVNHPFWLRVSAPKGTPPGTYSGTVTIKADGGWSCQVPVQIRIFDFTLPDEMTCQSAFGFSPGTVFQYHKPQTERQKRDLIRTYLEYFAKHRISLYNPAPLNPFTVKLVTKQNTPPWEGNFKLDEATKAEGRASLYMKDDSTRKNVSATCSKRWNYPRQGITVSFKFKAAKGHRALFTVSPQTSTGEWLWGGNYDCPLVGTGDWVSVTHRCPPPRKDAKTFTFTFRATTWTDDGTATGEIWYDDLKIMDNDTGKLLLHETFIPFQIKDYSFQWDWKQWDKAMAENYANYHFNSFKIPVLGLGSGTYHSRVQPTFFGFAEDTPEYKILHKKYLGELQQHLVETGWIDKAYVYWFDEPTPKDYPFVMNGFRKLKEGAPRIRRMLTEQVEKDLIGGPNLWCAITSELDLESVKPRQQAGDTIWWYVCTAPKAPYATLFIDHPGTELRAWLWQTWKHNISGILVWTTNYWTSNCAYPDPKHPQNPYVDPMSWVTGYSTKSGVKLPWGNGDGRFVYPPLAAANADSKVPVMEAPVSCIRAEMLRDGLEDYEYFAMLRKLISRNPRNLSPEKLDDYRKLLLVPQEVTKAMTEFTLDPQYMEQHRQKLAAAIEALK